MSTLRYAVNVPLALVAGIAIGSNPRWFADLAIPAQSPHHMSPVEAIRAKEPKLEEMAEPRGKRGPESPELRALRLAEDELFAELESEGLSFHDGDDLQSVVSSGSFMNGLNQPSFPIASHPAVERYLEFFASSPKGREMFSTWLKRSGRYREIIAKALREKGLPADLEAIAFVESGFWPTAKSSAGAVGLWQFMPATARAYGLTVSKTYDERRSPWRSSEAAAAHLSDLYARFNSWDLVLAAYNYGYHNVERRMSEAQIDDFWAVVDEEGVLPQETRKYVPKVQAVAVLLNNLDHFGFNASDLDEALRAAAFEVPPGTSLSDLARASGTTRANIKQLNPEFLTELVPDRGAPAVVHIPRSGLARARVMLPRLLGGQLRELEGNDSAFYDFGGGDESQQRLMATVVSRDLQKRQVADLDLAGEQERLRKDARRLRSSDIVASSATESVEETIMRYPVDLMLSEEPPMLSVLPQETLSSESSTATTRSNYPTLSRESALALAFVKYRVSQGDSVAKLAKRFGVSERELVLDNQIRDRAIIFRGQELKIRDTKKAPSRPPLEYQVKKGDSLEKIAKRLRESPETLISVNNIENPNLIRVGEIVRVPPS